MSDPKQYLVMPKRVEAIRRDGSISRDLAIVDWIHRSRPHGEYVAGADNFALRSARGELLPVGAGDWVVRTGADFLPCPDQLFVALTRQQANALCDECHGRYPEHELYPTLAGPELCADCLLESELNRRVVSQELHSNGLSTTSEQPG